MTMKHLLFAAILLLSSSLSVRADSSSGPLQITAPTGWTVKYDDSKGIQFYTLTKISQTPGDMTLLMFSRSPAFLKTEGIPAFLDKIGDGFLAMAKGDSRFTLASDSYTKGDFAGGSFSGKYIEFTIKGGMKQTMVIFGDGQEIWNGQYTGSAAGWDQAIEVLKGIKKNG